MVTTFFDSSVLAAIYLAEPHSAAARKAVSRVPVVPYTALHHLEVRNAFRLLVGWKRMTAAAVGGRAVPVGGGRRRRQAGADARGS